METNYRVNIGEIGHLTSSPSFLRCFKLCPGTQYEKSAPMSGTLNHWQVSRWVSRHTGG